MTTPTWTSLQRRLHWIVLAVVAGQYASQQAMRAAYRAAEAGEPVTFLQFAVTTLHTWGGGAVLALVVWRIVLRRRKPVPVAADSVGQRMAALIRWHHRGLYALLVFMALSGAAHWYLGSVVAGRWHETGKWVLGAAVLVHMIGAVWHRVIAPDASNRKHG